MGDLHDRLAPLQTAKQASDGWASRLGFALALRRPQDAQALKDAAQALSRLTGRSEWRFVLESTGLLALWVADLPASERHHHSRPFGLFEHSVEVAAALARNLDRRWNSERGGRILSGAERSMWARVAYTAALLHDAGKVLDVVVTGSEGGARWDPLREPLAFFKRRRNLAFGDPSPFRYRPYRGLRGHEANTAAVARAMFAAAPGGGLGPIVLWALSAYVERHRAADPALPVPLGYLARRIHEADVEMSRSGGRDRTSESGETHEQTA